MAYRVIQWGTGNVGLFALRCIIEHPQIELAGVWVHSAEKAGRDAGELCGDAADRRARDQRRRRASSPSTPTASATPPPPTCGRSRRSQDICRILAAGKNVVSSSIVPLVHPKSFIPNLREQLDEACRTGGTSFFTSGIDPGFANDLLPLTLSGLCGTWDEVRVLEIINYATYNQPQVLFDTMGFGKPLDDTPLLLTPGHARVRLGRHRAAARRGSRRRARQACARPTRSGRRCKPIRIGAHTVEPGTMAALRFEVQGIVGGRAAIVVEHVTRLDDDARARVADRQRQLPRA